MKWNYGFQASFVSLVVKSDQELPQTMNEWVQHALDTGAQDELGLDPMTCLLVVQHTNTGEL